MTISLTSCLTRRQLLEQSMSAAAAAAVGGRAVAAERQGANANERLSVAVVGSGGRGSAHARAFAGRKDCVVRYVCDADLTRANRVADAVAKQQKHRPKAVQDMRDALGDKTVVCEVRGLKTGPYRNAMNGVLFFGAEGYIAFGGGGTALFDAAGKRVKAFTGPREDHFGNFIKAVRSRKVEDLNADIEEGHQSSALCHPANISYLLGRSAGVKAITEQLAQRKVHEDAADTLERTVKHVKDNGVDVSKTKLPLGPWLALSADVETFAGNARANAMLTRPYRKPFVVPEVEKL